MREPTKEEIETIKNAFENAANPAKGWSPLCPAIDMINNVCKNDQEQKTMDKLVEFWNELVKLQPVHADEFNIYRFHFHGIQAQLIARGYIKDQLDKSPQGHLPAPERTTVISTLTEFHIC